ncbi:MAG: hypothetical protein ABEJ04_07795 [Halobacteriaceae archaeon]
MSRRVRELVVDFLEQREPEPAAVDVVHSAVSTEHDVSEADVRDTVAELEAENRVVRIENDPGDDQFRLT